MADDSWYYAQNNQQLGPVTLEVLRGMVASGQVGAADLVWTQGMSQWLPARSVPEVGSALLGGGGGGGGGGAGASPYGSPAGYAPAAGAGQLGYGVAPSYYQQQYQHVEYAGFWLRFCAFFIDWIILVIPFVIIGFIIGFANPQAFTPPAPGARPGMGGPGTTPGMAGLEIVLRVLEIVVGWLYFALQESSARQATLGKLAVGLKVTDADGARLSFGHATGRHFAKILSGCTIGIGYIMAGFTEKKQALHDIVAGTLVVKK